MDRPETARRALREGAALFCCCAAVLREETGSGNSGQESLSGKELLPFLVSGMVNEAAVRSGAANAYSDGQIGNSAMRGPQQ